MIPDDLLDESISGCNFEYEIFFKFTPCFQYVFYITKRDTQNFCDSYWGRLFNFYCLQNVFSCRNILSSDRIRLKQKTVKKIIRWISEKIENDKKIGVSQLHSELQNLVTILVF
jgi:hypothetical protein